MTQPAIAETVVDVPAGDHASSARARWAITRGALFTLLALFLPAVASLLAPIQTQDLGYHLRGGELLLELGEVVRTDVLSFSAQGVPWVNQQWAAGGTFALVYDLAGWNGLLLLRSAGLGLTFALVFAAALGVGANRVVASLVALASFLVAMPNLALRAQTFGLLFFAVVVTVLVYRRRQPWVLATLPLLFIAWGNIHGSFFIGWAAIGFAAVEDLLARSRLAAATITVGALSMLATLLNPWGLQMWDYVRDLSTDPMMPAMVTEWQPSTLEKATGQFFFASLAVMALLFLLRGRTLPWLQIAWLGTLALVGVKAVRGVAWWAVGAAPAAAVLVAGLVIRGRRLGDPALDAVRGVGYTVAAAALLLLFLVALPFWRTGDALFGPDGMVRDAPRAVTEALLAEATPEDRLFAEQTWGSWLEFAVPGVPIMVDSRIEVYDEAIWSDYLAAIGGRADWPEILDRWEVTYLALMPRTPLRTFVAQTPGWVLVAEDAEGSLYRRE